MRSHITLLLLFFAYLSQAAFSQTITPVKDLNPGSANASINDFIRVGTELIMMADDGTDGAELWRTDGTNAGTVQVRDIYPGADPAYPAEFVRLGSYVYFHADHPSYGVELWRSDGTFSGTTLVTDLNPGVDGGIFPSTTLEIVESNGKLFLEMNDGIHGRELHVSDGTAASTQLLIDSYSGTSAGIPGAGIPQEIVPFQHGVLFSTFEYDLTLGTGPGRELWFSDGTVAGTYRVEDIQPGTGSSSPNNITPVGSLAFFQADDGTHGEELWVTNGTPGPGNTYLVKDIRPGTFDSGVTNFVRVGTTLFFFANDGTHGVELWKTDGTSVGTVMVKDIQPGAGDGAIADMWGSAVASNSTLSYNGLLYFVGDDGVHGEELWRSDGTAAGTFMVADINPGAGSSLLDEFVIANGLLFFHAYDDTHGYELWATDGTGPNTQLVEDLNPGISSSLPTDLVQVGTNLLFLADNGSSGRELFMVDLLSYSLLPVTWGDLRAQPLADGTVQLDWRTLTETHNDRFVVERSADGQAFTAIGELPGKGDSDQGHAYQLLDHQPLSGRNVYRLRQVDLDGQSSYSPLVEVHVSEQPALRLHWKSETEHLHLFYLPTGPVLLTLSDLSGRRAAVRQVVSPAGGFHWHLPGLAPGLYLLRWQSANGIRSQSLSVR